MKRINVITEQELRIKEIYCVIENSITLRHIENLSGRHSDCFVLILSGETRYTFEDKVITVKPSDILYLAKGSKYTMDILTEYYQFIFVDFDFDDTNDTKVFSSDVFHMQNQINIEGFFRKLYKRWVMKKCAYKVECKAVLYELYAKIIQQSIIEYIPLSKQKILDAAMNIIFNHFTESNLSLIQLAKASNVSEVHFRRLFKEIYNVSPIKYIISLRIRRAKELMQFENLTITKIAELLGYSNIYYFCKVFKQETGCTPTEYKQKLNKNFIY